MLCRDTALRHEFQTWTVAAVGQRIFIYYARLDMSTNDAKQNTRTINSVEFLLLMKDAQLLSDNFTPFQVPRP